MWIFPMLTLGVLSVLTFCSGVVGALVAATDSTGGIGGGWWLLAQTAMGAVGVWWTVRLTPERS